MTNLVGTERCQIPDTVERDGRGTESESGPYSPKLQVQLPSSSFITSGGGAPSVLQFIEVSLRLVAHPRAQIRLSD
jgi:hypothetical protein